MNPIDPSVVFTAEEQKKVNEYRTKLDKAGREFTSKYILSDETRDAAWNAWIEKANNMGAQELVDIYNEAQKRYDN